jgi:hypothetical protein
VSEGWSERLKSALLLTSVDEVDGTVRALLEASFNAS